jgi:hypothetical protein
VPQYAAEKASAPHAANVVIGWRFGKRLRRLAVERQRTIAKALMRTISMRTTLAAYSGLGAVTSGKSANLYVAACLCPRAYSTLNCPMSINP